MLFHQYVESRKPGLHGKVAGQAHGILLEFNHINGFPKASFALAARRMTVQPADKGQVLVASRDQIIGNAAAGIFLVNENINGAFFFLPGEISA